MRLNPVRRRRHDVIAAIPTRCEDAEGTDAERGGMSAMGAVHNIHQDAELFIEGRGPAQQRGSAIAHANQRLARSRQSSLEVMPASIVRVLAPKDTAYQRLQACGRPAA